MHPDAKDSPDGIKRWWVSADGGPPTSEDLEVALAFIVAQGWLEERQVTPRQRIFAARINSMRLAAEYLQQLLEHANSQKEEDQNARSIKE
jgi:hypothetical protein